MFFDFKSVVKCHILENKTTRFEVGGGPFIRLEQQQTETHHWSSTKLRRWG